MLDGCIAYVPAWLRSQKAQALFIETTATSEPAQSEPRRSAPPPAKRLSSTTIIHRPFGHDKTIITGLSRPFGRIPPSYPRAEKTILSVRLGVILPTRKDCCKVLRVDKCSVMSILAFCDGEPRLDRLQEGGFPNERTEVLPAAERSEDGKERQDVVHEMEAVGGSDIWSVPHQSASSEAQRISLSLRMKMCL